MRCRYTIKVCYYFDLPVMAKLGAYSCIEKEKVRRDQLKAKMLELKRATR